MTCITQSPYRAAVGSEGEDVNWKSHMSSKGGNGYSCPADHCHVGFRLVVAKFLVFQKRLGIRLLSKNPLIKIYMYIFSEFFENSIMVPEPLQPKSVLQATGLQSWTHPTLETCACKWCSLQPVGN